MANASDKASIAVITITKFRVILSERTVFCGLRTLGQQFETYSVGQWTLLSNKATVAKKSFALTRQNASARDGGLVVRDLDCPFYLSQ